MPDKPKLYEVPGVEIFSSGKWNGDEWTVADIEEIVRAFNETSETWRPALKLGHDDQQLFLQEEGQPAAGWIGKLYRVGRKLVADLVDIPEKIYELLLKKSYRRVSSEIYLDMEVDGAQYKYMLGGVALLGAEMPGVMNLKEILANFSQRNQTKLNFSNTEIDSKIYSFDTNQGEVMPKTEREIELEAELRAEKAKLKEQADEVKKFKIEQKDADEALRDEKQKREAAEKKLFSAQRKAEEAELQSQVDQLVSEKIITPGMKPYALALLGDGEEENGKKVYKFKAGDENKNLSRFELVKSLCKQFEIAEKVNTSTQTTTTTQKNVSDVTDEQINEYAMKHKVSYSAAYKTLLKGKLTQGPEDGEE